MLVLMEGAEVRQIGMVKLSSPHRKLPMKYRNLWMGREASLLPDIFGWPTPMDPNKYLMPSEALNLNLPKSAMVKGGVCYPLKTPVRKVDIHWPTPLVGAYKGPRSPETLAAKGRTPTNCLCDAVRATTEGWLSPDWVEWLMGFPLEWSKADPAVLKTVKGL